MEILDSGDRTVFASGSVRDMHSGKGRMDLLPWAAIMEVSKHCENGALKYGEHFVRMEYHDFDGNACTIRNKAFQSEPDGGVGAEISLDTVPEWAEIEPEVRVENVTGPLFAYFKPPAFNSVDTVSDCGMSIYGDMATVELIKQADEQWEKLRWEFQSADRKIIMDGSSTTAGMFNKRLFEVGLFSADGNMFQFIEPTIRDEALYRGFQDILRRIEFNVGLAYGDISDPQAVEKTATEIRNSKQRKYVLISGIQAVLEHTFDALIYAIVQQGGGVAGAAGEDEGDIHR